jgi:hypothetical protein
MYYKIVDIFPLEESVQFLYHNDGNILESLLRGINNTIRSMESDLWESLMCHISEYMSTFYYNFKHVLQFNTFNVCQQVFYRATLYLKFDRFTCMYICSSCMSCLIIYSVLLISFIKCNSSNMGKIKIINQSIYYCTFGLVYF